MIVLPPEELAKIHRHAKATYPEECCGFLIGRGDRVLETRATENVHPDHRQTRYTVPPLEVLRLDRELRASDREHLGFYHSHPEHPAVPSEFDLARAWPGFAYLIVSLVGGEPRESRCWRLEPVGKRFIEESLGGQGT